MSSYSISSVKLQVSNMKHGHVVKPNVCELIFVPLPQSYRTKMVLNVIKDLVS